MDIGKAEYAPDYRSEHSNTLTRTNELIKELSERSRLEAEVVKAAKRRRKAKLAKVQDAGDYLTELHAAMVAEHLAVDALLEFEAQQGGE
jgi:hypothetical protein